MPARVFIVKLTEVERALLHETVSAGVASAGKLLHARILLKADQGEEGPGWPDARICEALEVSRATVERVRKQYVAAGVDAALARRRPPPRPRKLDGEGEAHLIATACSAPPEGHTRWTLRLLAGKLVELEQVNAISHETVRHMLKKTCSRRG
jgi:transposase